MLLLLFQHGASIRLPTLTPAYGYGWQTDAYLATYGLMNGILLIHRKFSLSCPRKMLHKIQELFMRLVRLVEEHPTPLRRYFQLYFAILAVRLTLEFFSSHRLFAWADVMHIALWFVFIVLAFLLQLHLFSGERITKVTRLCVVGFTIALTAPIIDLILHGGVGAKMNYMTINSWGEIPYAYLTLGGQSLSRGATLGIRIEIVLLVIASFNYVRNKRGSILWGLASALSIYTVLFLSGMVPRLMGMLVNGFGLAYGPGDKSTLLLLLLIDVLLLGTCLYRYAPKTVILVLRTVPWGTVMLAVCLVVVGAGLARREHPLNWSYDPTTLFHIPFLLVVVGCMAMLLGLQRLQISGQVAAPSAERARNFLLALSLGVALAIDSHVSFVIAAIWGLLFLLHEPPLNLHCAPLLRNLLESMALCATALLGFVTFGAPMVGFPVAWLIPLLIAQALGGLIWDLDSGRENAIPWLGTGQGLNPMLQNGYRMLVMITFVAGQGLLAYCFLPGLIWVGFLVWAGLTAGWFSRGKRSMLSKELGAKQSLPFRMNGLIWAVLPLYLAFAYEAWQ